MMSSKKALIQSDYDGKSQDQIDLERTLKNNVVQRKTEYDQLQTPHVYTLKFAPSTIDPADSKNYYIGGNAYGWIDGVGGIGRIYFPRDGIIRAVAIYVYCTVVASAENVAFSLRVNNTTDYSINATVHLNTASTLVANYALSIPVAVTDYFEIKVVTPAWATNPTGVFVGGHALIECN